MHKKMIFLCLLGALFVNLTASAKPVNSLSGLYACETILDKDAQLNCFLAETSKLRVAETSGDFITIDKQAAEEIEKESYGFNLPSLPKLKLFSSTDTEKSAKPLKTRSLAIKRTSTIRKGYLRFYLENGQIWDQTQPAKVRHLGQETPDILVIKNAALGSFKARVNGKGPQVRVRRIQ
ncbi:hypothetical protein [Hellea balneolensis]|uniref:hypothetical protein n=1 Tax=Hellea balneolensis TaxID=287478 RepID=UPI0004171B68|nr:hypothetical protein [Hellea balneolensis]